VAIRSVRSIQGPAAAYEQKSQMNATKCRVSLTPAFLSLRAARRRSNLNAERRRLLHSACDDIPATPPDHRIVSTAAVLTSPVQIASIPPSPPRRARSAHALRRLLELNPLPGRHAYARAGMSSVESGTANVCDAPSPSCTDAANWLCSAQFPAFVVTP
jgi:hypothetical protein